MKSFLFYSILAVCPFIIFYYWYFSPIWLLISLLFELGGLGIALTEKFSFRDNIKNVVLLFSVLGNYSPFIIGVVALFYNNGIDYHISSYGDHRHLYADCSKKISNSDEIVSKLGATIWGCYEDCNVCNSRKETEEAQAKEEKERKRQEKIENERINNIDVIRDQIAQLEQVLERLEAGDYVDISGYAFRDDVEEEIYKAAKEDVLEELNDNFDESERYFRR